MFVLWLVWALLLSQAEWFAFFSFVIVLPVLMQFFQRRRLEDRDPTDPTL